MMKWEGQVRSASERTNSTQNRSWRHGRQPLRLCTTSVEEIISCKGKRQILWTTLTSLNQHEVDRFHCCIFNATMPNPIVTKGTLTRGGVSPEQGYGRHKLLPFKLTNCNKIGKKTTKESIFDIKYSYRWRIDRYLSSWWFGCLCSALPGSSLKPTREIVSLSFSSVVVPCLSWWWRNTALSVSSNDFNQQETRPL